MAWRALTVQVPSSRAQRVTGVLFGLGSAGVQEDHLHGTAPPPRQPWDTGPPPPPPPVVLLRAWFEDPDPAPIERALQAAGASAPRWEPVPEQDWANAWREGFQPVVISPRLVIAPPWSPSPGAVLVEPGQGFGTGQHPTTVASLQALDALADQVHTVLDAGCGSGVLALAAARLGLKARGFDLDPVAVQDARANAERNDLDVPFEVARPAEVTMGAELVLANLYAEVLVQEAPHLRRLAGRWLVLAGVLRDREGLVRQAFDPHLELVHRAADGEWVCLRYRVRG